VTDADRQWQLAELQAQVARLRSDHHERSSDRSLRTHKLYVVLGVGMSMMTMIVVAAIYVLKPGDTNLSTTIIGITMPSALALIGYGLNHNIRGVYHLADGNLSVVKRDLNVALDKIERLQEVRVEEAQRTVPLVADGDTLKIPSDAHGLIVEKRDPKP
jgi:hypothetical protein